jgi:hypothetical protein
MGLDIGYGVVKAVTADPFRIGELAVALSAARLGSNCPEYLRSPGSRDHRADQGCKSPPSPRRGSIQRRCACYRVTRSDSDPALTIGLAGGLHR